MKEKIQDKIHAHIESILKKDAIDFNDYQILCGELARLEAKERTEATEKGSNQFSNMLNMIALSTMMNK